MKENPLDKSLQDLQLSDEMYMHFGRAIALSQNFEKSLASLLRGLLAKENVRSLPYEDFLRKADRFNEKTPLGELIKEVKRKISAEKIPDALFQKVLTSRNHLIHNYFFENAAKESVPDGKLSIIKDLLEYQKIFFEAVQWADTENRKLLYTIGMTEEKLANYMEKLLQKEVAEFRSDYLTSKLS